MKFDANYECIITIYVCARECRNASNIPLYFYTDPTLPVANAYKFSPGLNQDFPSKLWTFDTSAYNKAAKVYGGKLEDLFSAYDDCYPLVISIETIYPEVYSGKGKKNI